MNAEKTADAVRRYQAGEKWREIRAATGVSWSFLWRALRRRAIPRARYGGGREVPCAFCGVPVYRNATQLKRAPRYFCCRSHKTRLEAAERRQEAGE